MFESKLSTAKLVDPLTPAAENGDTALFTPNAVLGAAILGGPLGGAFLIALNYRRMSRPRSAVWAVVWGIIVLGIAMALGRFVPESWAFGASFLLAFAMKTVAQSLQGRLVSAHLERGGRSGSGWTALAVGLAGLVVSGIPLVATYLLAGANSNLF